MGKDRPRVLDRSPDIEIPALRVVGRDEIKSARIAIVDAGWIHEAARARRFESLRQLPDGKYAEIRRQGDQAFFLQKADDLCQAAFIGAEKFLLVRRNMRRAPPIRGREF